MAEAPNIFRTTVPAGSLVVNSTAVLGQPVHIHQALNRGISAAMFNLMDSSSISEGARVADEIARKNAELTGSSNGALGIRGVHPVIDGIADLRETARKLASG